MGFPLRGRSRVYAGTKVADCLARFERHASGFFPPGQSSDDGQGALAVAAAIVEAGGFDRRAIAEHLIPLWRDRRIVEAPAPTSEAMERLIRGKVAFEDSGLPVGSLGGDALARAVPVGLAFHARPESLAEAAGSACAITHRDPRVQAAAAGVAAAVAFNASARELILRDFLDRVAAAAGRFHAGTADWVADYPRLLSITEHRVFEWISRFAAQESGEAPRRFEQGVGDNGLSLFLEALYYFLKSPFDLGKALKSGLAAGGEVSSLCALIGAFGGSFLGEDAVPEALLGAVQGRDEARALADRMVAIGG
jgi:ADP-ribosylglycohydrolase